MQTDVPSRTAWAAAVHRAVHQVLEGGRILRDPLALRIVEGGSESADTLVRQAEGDAARRRMRLFIAMRSRFAEDALAEAVEQGVRQLVVLGAGLDTYAYRGAMRERLHVFEVDHPATQRWKRERLAEAGIPLPGALTFVPVDFERQGLAEQLSVAGFDPAQQTFFTWLGVVPYLTAEAMSATLAFVARLPGGAHIVFDYGDAPELLDAEQRAEHDARAARVAAIGEAWINYPNGPVLRSALLREGFRVVEDLGMAEILERFFPGRPARAPRKGGHLVRASTLDR